MNNRTRGGWLGVMVMGIVLTPASYWLYQWGEGNFHVVSEGNVYRSRQLSTEELITYVQRYRIKSVLNLRGMNKGDRWYQDEIHTAELLGVQHYDYGISANHEVAPHDIRNIIAVIEQAPKPILIHCKFGSDRTGLIAAVYLFAVQRKAVDEAQEQLSLRYGHFPYLWSRSDAMDRSFARYVGMTAR